MASLRAPACSFYTRSGVTVEHMAPSNGHHAGGRAKGDELNKIERRRREVAHLITAHYIYREMAERLGVASSTISEDVKVIGETMARSGYRRLRVTFAYPGVRRAA